MDALFNNVLAHTSDEITVISAIIAMLAALISGGIIASTYYKTHKDCDVRSMAITLLMLPVILTVIIIFIGSNIARAFSLAGTLSIIRFRSAAGEPEDIGYIFFDIAAGLACGVGLYAYGILFVLVLCTVMIIADKINLFKSGGRYKSLKITVPESLNYQYAFDEIFSKYTKSHRLLRTKTTDLGSLYELSYSVTLKDINEKEFLDELRTRNGNLTIMLNDPVLTLRKD